MRPSLIALVACGLLAGTAIAPATEPGPTRDPNDPWAFVPREQRGIEEDMPAEQEASGGETAVTTAPLPDPASIDWSVLNSETPAARATARGRTMSQEPAAVWTRSDKPGATGVSVKQPLPFLDTRIGADMTYANGATAVPLPEKLASESQVWQSSGVAWAAVSMPGFASLWDKTSVEARIDPRTEQSRLATSVSKTVPLAASTSLTVQGSVRLIEESAVPVFGRASRVEADRSGKLTFETTGTSLVAGESLSASDRWLRSIGAEQKLFGGVSVSGTLNQTDNGAINKSLSAGFKTNW